MCQKEQLLVNTGAASLETIPQSQPPFSLHFHAYGLWEPALVLAMTHPGLEFWQLGRDSEVALRVEGGTKKGV